MNNAFASQMSVRKYARLAALGAVGVSLGVLALYLIIAIGSRPTPTGGIDTTEAILTWISAAIPCGAIIAVHLAYAKVLLDEAKKPA
jgi:hypothetical protein